MSELTEAIDNLNLAQESTGFGKIKKRDKNRENSEETQAVKELREQLRVAQEKLQAATTHSVTPALQTIQFEPKQLGKRGKTISKGDIDAFEEHLRQAEVANVAFKPESFIQEDHLAMISRMAKDKYPDWRVKPWRDIIKILREICQTEQGELKLVNVFRNRNKVEFLMHRAVKKGQEIQQFLLAMGIFEKVNELSADEVLETKKDLIRFHRGNWARRAQEWKCEYL